MDIQYYNEEELRQLNIFELRDAARAAGVASATTKRKEDLIREYLAIASGEVVPQAPRRGRPLGSKNRNKSAKVEEPVFVSVEPKGKRRPETTFFDDHGNPITDPQVNTEGLDEKMGVLDIHPDGYGFLRAENCEYGNKGERVWETPMGVMNSIGV